MKFHEEFRRIKGTTPIAITASGNERLCFDFAFDFLHRVNLRLGHRPLNCHRIFF